MVGRSSHQEVLNKKEVGFKVGKCALNSEKREHLLKTASGLDKVTIKNIAKASSAPRQTSEMDPFSRTFNRLELLAIPADTYIKNATQDV